MKAMYTQAGILPVGIALPVIEFVQSFINFFADDDAEDDDESEDGKIVDDLDDEDDSELFGKKDEDGDEDEDEDSKSKGKEDKSKSAIIQKQKYRDLYKKTDKELKELRQKLEEKEKAPTDDAQAKKEKEARDYLRKLIAEELDTRKSVDDETQKELDEQMTELLEDNDDLTEKQILDVVEELGVTPKQAVAAIRREQRADGKGKRAKPNVPRSKHGADGDVGDDKNKSKKPATLEEATERAKKQLRELNKR